MKFRCTFFFAVLALQTGLLRADSSFLWEGFEREVNWFAEDRSAASGRAVDSAHASEGSHSLKMMFKTSSKSGRAVYTRMEKMDWSPYAALVLDIYNPSGIEDLKASVIITSTEHWIQHEAALPPLSPGWNRDLKVDLTKAQFSSPASSYKPIGYLVGRGEIQSVSLALEPGVEADSAVYADNLRLIRGGVLNKGDFTLNLTLEGVASGGDLGYLPPGMRLRRGDFRSLESFESGQPWTSSKPGVRLETSAEHASQGSQGLRVGFDFISEGFDVTMHGIETQLAKAKLFRMDIYNPGAAISVALWMVDGNGKTYTSESKWLMHGWNTPVFDFSNQNAWNGQAIEPQTLANLSSVNLAVYPSYGGALYFDALSSSSINVAGAAQTSALASLSYHPSPDLELRVDTQVEDTFYGSGESDLREAGAELYLDAANLRYDVGGFRNKLIYRHRVTDFDQPIMPLIFSGNLGTELAAFESGGRVGPVELQGLATSRLEYGEYNSRKPTGFGPDHVQGLRARSKIGKDSRLGVTLLNHQAVWDKGVTGLPSSRQTYGLDLDSNWKRGRFSLAWAAEGAYSPGDGHPSQAGNFFVQAGDRGYLGGRVTPEWGRLKLDYYYSLVGYDFDADFTQYGGNEEWHYAEGTLNLEGLGFLKRLKDLPLYDGSIGNNLRLLANAFTLVTRAQYLEVTGRLLPVNSVREYHLRLENDYKAKPHFALRLMLEQTDDQWNFSGNSGGSIVLSFPAGERTTLSLEAGHHENSDLAKSIAEAGLGGTNDAELGLEWHSDSNLFVNIKGIWKDNGKSWQGTWGPEEGHFKWSAGLQQNFGSDTVLRLDYGLPALLGYDFGLQDTLNVLTLTLKTYL
ncbi:MAG: hypothetical protein V4498_00800 [candidate division FCPU426 bacterium]